MRNKVTHQDIIIYIFHLSAILSLFGGVSKIPWLTVFGGFLLVYLSCILARKNTKKWLGYMGPAVLILAVSFIYSKNLSVNIKYFCNWLLVLIVFDMYSYEKFKNQFIVAFKKHPYFLEVYYFLYALILAIHLIAKNGYIYVWNGRYFAMYTTPHAVAASACFFISSLALKLFIKRKKIKVLHMAMYAIYLAIALYAILETGSRVFLISVLGFFYIYVFKYIKKKSYRWVVIIVGVTAGMYILINSSMAIKMLEMIESANTYNSQSQTGILGAFTSRRTDFWLADIKEYFTYDFLSLLFGKGFDYIFEVNQKLMGLYIWGHNDIIMSLVSAGAVGLIIYLRGFIRYLKENSHADKKSRTSLYLYVLLPLLLNGLMNYSSYIYSIVMIVTIIEVDSLRKTQIIMNP